MKHLKITRKCEKNIGNDREFCRSGKVGTMSRCKRPLWCEIVTEETLAYTWGLVYRRLGVRMTPRLDRDTYIAQSWSNQTELIWERDRGQD